MVLFEFKEFTGKILNWPEESQNYGRLRYDYFVGMRGWQIPSVDNNRKLDLDNFDLSAIHIGLYHLNQLVGYTRLLLDDSPSGMLFQQPFFNELIPYKDWTSEKNSCELSRFCFQKNYRPGELFKVLPFLLLSKATHDAAVLYKRKHLYIITAGEDKKLNANHLKFFQHFFPLQIISGPIFYEDGTETYCTIISVEQIRDSLQKFMIL